MQLTNIIACVSALAVAAMAAPAPAPAPAPGSNDCVTVYHTTWIKTTSTTTSTVMTTSACPIVSLPLSPIVTGTIVPVGSITSDVGSVLSSLKKREPTAALEARGGSGSTTDVWETSYTCVATSTVTVTSTVKPSCAIVNPSSV